MKGTYTARIDGAARGNPGPAGIGVILDDPSGGNVARVAAGVGWATNNIAEYKALLEALNLALARGVKHLLVVSDSTLLVQQMKGRFKVKHPGLKQLNRHASDLARRFTKVDFKAVPREQNADADRLANEGIDDWIAANPDFEPPEAPQQELF